jgi:hypothetical protein
MKLYAYLCITFLMCLNLTWAPKEKTYIAELPEIIVKAHCLESFIPNKKLSWHQYEPLFSYIADKTKLTKGAVYAIIRQESSFRSQLFTHHYNFGGTKGRRSNRTVTYSTPEIYNGKRVIIKAKFNSYDNLKDAADDFIDMINSRYDKYIPDNATNRQIFIGLKRGGYHTDNSQYVRIRYANEYDKKTSLVV